jgi:hypothetical protein
MAQIKIYLDEDVHNLIAETVRRRGWEAQTTIEAGNQRAPDMDQIRYASERGYCIVTYNVTDFPRLHYEIRSRGDHHSGIIVATQDRPSINAKTLLKLLGTFAAEDFVDQLIYLNNWMDG